MMKIVAYLQGANGEEFTLHVDQPEPTSAKLDKTLFFPPAAVEALKKTSTKETADGYWWIRVVSNV